MYIIYNWGFFNHDRQVVESHPNDNNNNNRIFLTCLTQMFELENFNYFLKMILYWYLPIFDLGVEKRFLIFKSFFFFLIFLATYFYVVVVTKNLKKLWIIYTLQI